MIKIGWVPYCCSEDDGHKDVIGFWPAYFEKTKRECEKVRINRGFKFKIVPVYAEIPQGGKK